MDETLIRAAKLLGTLPGARAQLLSLLVLRRGLRGPRIMRLALSALVCELEFGPYKEAR